MLSQYPSVSESESALYGYFSASFTSNAFCVSWYDYLWLHCSHFIDTFIDHSLAFRCGVAPDTPLPSLQSIKQHFIPPTNENDIFTTIQSYLLLDQKEELSNLLTNVILSPPTTTQLPSIRFLVHLFLLCCYRQNDPKSDRVVDAYVDLLIRRSEHTIIGYYVSLLSVSLQIQRYSDYLLTLHHQSYELQHSAVTLALQYHLPILQIIHNVVSQLCPSLPTSSQFPSQLPTQNDEERVNSLLWYSFSDNLTPQKLTLANRLAIEFILQKKFESAKLLFLPPNGISKSDLRLVRDLLSEVKLHIELHALLDAFDAFDEWESHLTTPDTNYSESVVCDAIQKCLHSQWLIDQKEIRQMYVPELILMLQSVCLQSAHHHQCLNTANIISENDFIHLFTKSDLAKVLSNINTSALYLMQTGVHPSDIGSSPLS
jgi:hypothetical protein